MLLMYAVIAVFKSFSLRGRSRYTDSQILSAQRLSERTVLIENRTRPNSMWKRNPFSREIETINSFKSKLKHGARSPNRCRYGKTTMFPPWYSRWHTCRCHNAKCWLLPWKRNGVFHLHSCRITKYFVLLPT
jgi:hypothetical protein